MTEGSAPSTSIVFKKCISNSCDDLKNCALGKIDFMDSRPLIGIFLQKVPLPSKNLLGCFQNLSKIFQIKKKILH